MRTKLKNIIYGKLGLNDGIENIQNLYQKVRNKNQKSKEQGPKLKYQQQKKNKL